MIPKIRWRQLVNLPRKSRGRAEVARESREIANHLMGPMRGAEGPGMHPRAEARVGGDSRSPQATRVRDTGGDCQSVGGETGAFGGLDRNVRILPREILGLSTPIGRFLSCDESPATAWTGPGRGLERRGPRSRIGRKGRRLRKIGSPIDQGG
jgi:hypothetical protein